MPLSRRKGWTFFATLPRANATLAIVWYIVLILRGVLPAVFAVVMGVLISAVQHGSALTLPLAATGVIFIVLQALPPIHTAVGYNLGDRMAAFLYDRLTEACVRPPGIAHLEHPELTNDLTVARDFDLGMTGPPINVSMDFIASGASELIGGLASAIILFAFAWWAPLVLVAAWAGTHWFLRESGVWYDRHTPEVRAAQRDADYAYRLAVDPPAAKELRLFGLAGWVLERFIERRTLLHRLQYEATRLREKPVMWSLLVVVAGNVIVFWALASSVAAGRISTGELVAYAQCAVGVSLIAFSEFSLAVDGPASAVAAVLGLEEKMARIGALPRGNTEPARTRAPEIRFRGVGFSYPSDSGARPAVLDDFSLTIPAGTSLAIVGQNGAGKTTLAKLLCRLYDPDDGRIEIDGVDLRTLDVDAWRQRLSAVCQDYIRFELPLRHNDAPDGAPDDVIRAALADAGASHLANLDPILSRAYERGTDLSGGQWQRVALARALCAVRMGARVVLLDEPTAQLDVRGEMEIFERVLGATRHCTTILISHRFSTVRLADRICVVEHGRVVELGTHDELMARGGRYRTMFDLQAQRFGEAEVDDETEPVSYDVLS
jgi:ABC-type multidrug transport system fused ATPase/permease subunit